MRTIDLNKQWVVKDRISDVSDQVFGGAQATEIKVDLPYDAMIETTRDKSNATGSDMGYFEAKDYEFTKTFTISSSDQCAEIILQFAGIYGNSTFLINDQVVGHHSYGFGPFSFTVQDYINFGQENELKILIRNSQQPSTRWYSGAGLLHSVSLLIGDVIRIDKNLVKISTENCDEDTADLVLDINILNSQLGSKKVTLKHEIFDQNQQTVAVREQVINLQSLQTTHTTTRIYVSQPHLWSVETPYLYTCRTSLIQEGTSIDDCTNSFGIRTLRLNNQQGLLINGKSVKLRGGCLHPDNGVLGTAGYYAAEERKILKLKSAGYNAIRSAHNPISQELLEACDRQGMLIMDEFTDVWTKAKTPFDYASYMETQWKQDIDNLVNRDFNHPSVILYSIGNEIPETGTDKSTFWGRQFIDEIHALDTTRYTINAINPTMSNMDKLPQIAESLKETIPDQNINDLMNNFNELMPLVNTHEITSRAISESADMVDIVGYNYAAARYELDHKDFPNRIFIGTETNPADLATNWQLVTEKSYVLGDFSWTAWDYLGEVGIGRIVPDDGKQFFTGAYPWLSSACGDFDLIGERKPVSYWRQTVWSDNPKPYIAVQNPVNYGKKMFAGNWAWTDTQHSWTWPESENQSTTVEVYSNADEVELILNGHSLGRKKQGESSIKNYFKWQLKYVPGRLEAISYVAGKAVGKDEIHTTKPATKIQITAENKTQDLKQSLHYFNITAVDANGELDINCLSHIKVTVTGDAELKAVTTGNPMPDDKYVSNNHDLYQGRALVIIQTNTETNSKPSVATIHVSSETLADTELKVDFS